MRVVVQRTGNASCEVNNEITGEITYGLAVFVSVDPEDTESDIDWMGNKVSGLRIFPDGDGKMNRSILDVQEDWKNSDAPTPENRPGILSISQFTLHGNARKGFRPSFVGAADPVKGEEYYRLFNENLRSRGLRIEEGIFGAMMDISLVNEGPVTILIDSKHQF